MTHLLVTGSRSITDEALVVYALEQTLHDLGGTVARLIHGGAAGVDTLAGKWAERRGIPTSVVRPHFDQGRGNRAYLERDAAMVDMATHVVAIWDGQSRGTQYTFEYARTKGNLIEPIWLEAHLREELFG
jgi:hypothetical protein